MSGVWSNRAAANQGSASAKGSSGEVIVQISATGRRRFYKTRRAPVVYRYLMQRVRVLDSHTAGEPTRVILEGGPDLGRGSLAERRERFRAEFDSFRSAMVNEPRGSDAVVGALL